MTMARVQRYCSDFKPRNTSRQCRICSLTRCGDFRTQRIDKACSTVSVFSLFLQGFHRIMVAKPSIRACSYLFISNWQPHAPVLVQLFNHIIDQSGLADSAVRACYFSKTCGLFQSSSASICTFATAISALQHPHVQVGRVRVLKAQCHAGLRNASRDHFAHFTCPFRPYAP